MRRTIDELVVDKIFSLVKLIISVKVKPDITIDAVTELTEKEIDDLKCKKGIEGVILDLDETLRTQMKRIPLCNQEWLEMIKGKLKVIIVSNGADRNVEEFFRKRGIHYIGIARKPLKKNFLKACQMMEVDTDKVLVIGDDLFSDIYGGKRNNMSTALIKGKVKDEEVEYY